MATRHHQLSIVEAVETLSNIADLDYDQQIGVVQKHEIRLLEENITYKTVNWLHQQGGEVTINLVREIFRIVTYYLQEFYNGEHNTLTNHSSLEGIKAIMILVEEAAKKLDKYAEIFFKTTEKPSSVTEFKEYKQLQDIYRSKIARKQDEGSLSKWILSLSLKKDNKLDENFLKNIPITEFPAEVKENKRAFVNLETVQIDSEYELLQIRKQDSSRFFNPRLLRNVKLTCDLEKYFRAKKQDPFVSIDFWFDHIAYSSARHMIKNLGGQLDLFFKELRNIKNNELVVALNKTVMALMFSAQNRNLLHHQPIKSCTSYFEDFLLFLREALRNPLYKKWSLEPPKKTNDVAWDLLKFVHRLCSVIYTNSLGWEEIPELVSHLLKSAKQTISKEYPALDADCLIWEKIAYHHAAFTSLIKQHPHGPYLKLIKGLERNCLNAFDPLHQQNIPQQLFDMHYQDQRISLIRMATPTHQQLIDRAMITEEFKAFIKDYGHFSPSKKHLIINLQNRTSWKEFARCDVLEKLQFQADFLKELCVVTLAIDTDFYFQLEPYHEIVETQPFIQQFKEHLLDHHSGFYFPSEIKIEALENFTYQASEAILKIFFSSQQTLNRDQRLNFIEIFYLLLEIKLLEWTQAQTFSLMCKDGIDQGSTRATLFFIFLKLINREEMSENDEKFIDLMLFMPALLLRERVILAEPFNRMLNTLKFIEETQQKVGIEGFKACIHQELNPLFDSGILQSTLLTPHLKTHLPQNFDKTSL